ncbi:hypothetical protein QMA77_08120 [Pantoea ananatis]|nr:hypothetical protein [Pantoea ananatis]MDI6536898.1 hypothetical protein [Pantoea ananatis]
MKMYQERREALKETVSLGADFVPIVGDIKVLRKRSRRRIISQP